MFKTKLIKCCLELTVAEQGVNQLPIDKILMIVDYADEVVDSYKNVSIDISDMLDTEIDQLMSVSACPLSSIILKKKIHEEGE